MKNKMEKKPVALRSRKASVPIMCSTGISNYGDYRKHSLNESTDNDRSCSQVTHSKGNETSTRPFPPLFNGHQAIHEQSFTDLPFPALKLADDGASHSEFDNQQMCSSSSHRPYIHKGETQFVQNNRRANTSDKQYNVHESHDNNAKVLPQRKKSLYRHFPLDAPPSDNGSYSGEKSSCLDNSTMSPTAVEERMCRKKSNESSPLAVGETFRFSAQRTNRHDVFFPKSSSKISLDSPPSNSPSYDRGKLLTPLIDRKKECNSPCNPIKTPNVFFDDNDFRTTEHAQQQQQQQQLQRSKAQQQRKNVQRKSLPSADQIVPDKSPVPHEPKRGGWSVVQQYVTRKKSWSPHVSNDSPRLRPHEPLFHNSGLPPVNACAEESNRSPPMAPPPTPIQAKLNGRSGSMKKIDVAKDDSLQDAYETVVMKSPTVSPDELFQTFLECNAKKNSKGQGKDIPDTAMLREFCAKRLLRRNAICELSEKERPGIRFFLSN